MDKPTLHPLARILLLCGWAVAVEAAALPVLALLAVVSATAFVFAPARADWLRLLRRSRWLLAVLLLTYAYATPGTALWPAFGWASPAIEGLQQGALRLARLALLLAGVALLLAATSRPRLIYGLYALAWPLARVGFDRRAFAVRLGLTLDYVAAAPPRGRWLDALRAVPADPGTPTTYALHAERWQSHDSAVILAGLLGVWGVLA